MERLSLDYGKKSKLEFAVYPAVILSLFLSKLSIEEYIEIHSLL